MKVLGFKSWDPYLIINAPSCYEGHLLKTIRSGRYKPLSDSLNDFLKYYFCNSLIRNLMSDIVVILHALFLAKNLSSICSFIIKIG